MAAQGRHVPSSSNGNHPTCTAHTLAQRATATGRPFAARLRELHVSNCSSPLVVLLAPLAHDSCHPFSLPHISRLRPHHHAHRALARAQDRAHHAGHRGRRCHVASLGSVSSSCAPIVATAAAASAARCQPATTTTTNWRTPATSPRHVPPAVAQRALGAVQRDAARVGRACAPCRLHNSSARAGEWGG